MAVSIYMYNIHWNFMWRSIRWLPMKIFKIGGDVHDNMRTGIFILRSIYLLYQPKNITTTMIWTKENAPRKLWFGTLTRKQYQLVLLQFIYHQTHQYKYTRLLFTTSLPFHSIVLFVLNFFFWLCRCWMLFWRRTSLFLT